MTRHEKVKEIYAHAKILGSNMTTLVFLLAVTNDKALTKFHKTYLDIEPES